MSDRQQLRHARLFCGAAFAALALATGAAQAQAAGGINIAPQSLDTAINELGAQSNQQVLIRADVATGKMTRGVTGATNFEVALNSLLEGTGLSWRREGDTFLIVQGGSSPQGASAAGGGATVEALIVTAQKREEDIQDVPIAISAFSQKQLDAQKIEGGFDLLKAIPNVTFTKTNFTSYNFQIRGIGTQATSATTDPGVAVAFNNSGIIQNRLFEQEYLDVERVEVLRGPQGTLYGRNATAGVINVISAKPRMGQFLAEIKGELGNYNAARLRGMVNIPVGDTLAVRLAAAWTDREGYTFNSGTGRRIDGRDLWTGRVTVGWEPTPQFRADLIWEHFEEDDDRLRTGKQLCHRDDGPETVGDVVIADIPVSPQGFKEREDLVRKAIFSQGCKPGSLYDDGAFGTPNGLSYNFVLGLLSGATSGSTANVTTIGKDANGEFQTLIQFTDPYGGKMQSRDLREIDSSLDPTYRAEADLLELNVDFDLSDYLTFTSQTAYVHDETFSFQDFNRFNTEPIFTDTDTIVQVNPYYDRVDFAPGGTFCDPQIGCTDKLAGFDIAQASAEQFNQEFRLQSSFDGPVNFSLGANYTRFDTVVDYYVFFNLITAMARIYPFNSSDEIGLCPGSGFFGDSFGDTPTVPTNDPISSCPHIDTQPVSLDENFDGDGHNYFRSKNPYELESWAVFGELYWNIQDDLKLTAGLRYTDDTKIFTPVPSQVLLSRAWVGGGAVSSGYPEEEPIKQQWGEWTGRLVLDWKPELEFTDSTLVYGSFARGYKGGGANPPHPDFATEAEIQQAIEEQGLGDQYVGLKGLEVFLGRKLFPILELTGVEYGETFEAEFVNAFEFGTKNTLLGGGLTVNTTAFYYDYTDYQVSQIRDRTAVNENFDAEMWGLELETLFTPTENWQFLANIGYLNTQIADGETSIDIMNRTQGDPDYTLVKPWAQLPSNCVVPTSVAESYLNYRTTIGGIAGPNPFTYNSICGGVGGILGLFRAINVIDPATGLKYDVNNYPELNGGAGLRADLSGNELPNAPHWTANIGGQYTFHLPNEWDLVVRGDAYWQSQSYHRVYNFEPYDKLHGWYNANLVVWAENPELGLHIEAYVKNLFNNDPITGAFLNSDDTGLTTNVFMLDPRLYGISIRKSF